MRKGIIILLLSIYAITQLCTALICHYRSALHSFYFMKQQLRMQDDNMGKKELVMDIRDYQQAKREKSEIEWKGKLYDIINATVTGNKVYLELIGDEEENKCMKILDSFASLPDQDQSSQTPKENQAWEWLFKIYSPGNKISELPLVTEPATSYCFIKEFPVSSLFISVPWQPPDLSA